MAKLSVAFLGDVVGEPGIRAFAHAAEALRRDRRADLIFVNGENARNGSGLSPENYKALRRAGADAITLGDHCYKDARISEVLEDPEKPVCRPANLSPFARGKTRLLITTEALPEAPPIALVTVLGRLFMPLPADDPFAAVDREMNVLTAEHPHALAIVEVHAETTSEKIAMSWHCAAQWRQTVVAVVGTHTHVQTADARLVEGRLGAMTDLGMCGGRRGVIGREIEPVLSFMTRQTPAFFAVASSDPAASGVVIHIDCDERRCERMEPVLIETPAGPGATPSPHDTSSR